MRYARGEARAWAREELRDYIVVTTTPMLADLRIDEEGLRSNVERLLQFSRTGGIYVNSIYQEFWTLTLAERKRLTEIVLTVVAGRVPVIVGANANCVEDVLELATHAQDAGADLVMVWPPTFGQRSPEGVLEFYREIARQLSIGICVYASSLKEIGFQLTPPMLLELARIENVAAVKEASLSVSTYLHTLELIGDQLPVSSPLEEYWLYGRLLFGERAARFLFGSSRPLYLQPLLTAFLDAVDREDIPAANRQLQSILTVADRLHNRYLEGGEHNVALTKAITGLAGFVAGPCRPPISPPTADEVDEARAVLANAGVLLEMAAASGFPTGHR